VPSCGLNESEKSSKILLSPSDSLRGQLVNASTYDEFHDGKNMTSRIFHSLLILTFAPWTSLGQSSFTRITSGPVVSERANSLGAAWVDFDGDGDLDLYVAANQTGGCLLYRNDGQGVFTKITDGPLVNTGEGSRSVAWADMDNDGRIDLFLGRRPGPGLFFLQAPGGTFAQSSLFTGTCFGAAWADYDNDGFADLLVAQDGQSVLWRNNGQGGLVAVTGAGIDVSGSAIHWVDYDNDGDADLLITESGFIGGGASRLYRNDGRGTFTRITRGPLVERSTAASGAAWGDYDNDGFADVFICRIDSAGEAFPSFLFHNNGDGTFTQVEQRPFTDDVGASRGASWADVDNDGWLDLFVSEQGGGGNRLYHNNGDGTFTPVLSGPIGLDVALSGGCSWGDYDRNGFLDLLVANQGSENFLYRNERKLQRLDRDQMHWHALESLGTRSKSAHQGNDRGKNVLATP
jgi:hypothetical protein